MKLKNFSLIVGAIAFSLTVMPQGNVQAESTSKAPLKLAQAPQQTQPSRIQLPIKLTDQQKKRIAEINAKASNQAQQVLTPLQREQLKKIEVAVRSGQSPQQAVAALDNTLTQDQKQKLAQIRSTREKDLEAVFTPEQKQQIQQYLQNLRRQQLQQQQQQQQQLQQPKK